MRQSGIVVSAQTGAELTFREMTIRDLALVTGGTGMVGSAIVRALVARGRVVRVLARNPRRAYGLFGKSVMVMSGDLRDGASLLRATAGAEEIYHAAAELGFRTGKGNEIVEINVEGTRRLLSAARTNGVSRFVYTSSVAGYGDGLMPGITEEAPANPSATYGLSKVWAENLVRDAVEGGLHGLIVRPCVVYGPGDRYLAPQTVSALRLPIIPLPDAGRHIIDLVHADDVAAAHLLVMDSGSPGEAYNVTDGGRYSLSQVVSWMAKGLDRYPWRPSVPAWAVYGMLPLAQLVGRICHVPEMAALRRRDVAVFLSDYHFDIAKIRALGYNPRIMASTGLAETLHEYARRCAVPGRSWRKRNCPSSRSAQPGPTQRSQRH